MIVGIRVCCALALATACSPYGGGAFTCDTDEDCTGGPGTGRCELAAGVCSFADSECPTGFRYGEASGAMAGTCVEVDGPDVDAMPDMQVDPNCVGTGLARVCLQTLPAAPLTIDAARMVSTTTGSPDCAPTTSGPDVCVLAGTDVTISAALVATGARPLVIVATGTVSVTTTGTIDVASHRLPTETIGAGANATCVGAVAPTAGSGGAGGSFGQTGAAGGVNTGLAGTAGQPGPTTTLVLVGGCAGQPGHGNAGTGGPAGHGGGVAYLIGNAIVVAGTINASGEGGAPAPNGTLGGGAGGGGSGGLIVLDAATVTVAQGARIFANGGGGGEGNGTGGTQGAAGADPAAPGVAAAGGALGSNSGGDGGAGGFGMTAAAGGNPTTTGTGGGGGGGGGVGIVKIYGTPSVMGEVSPPSQ